ncbi:ROK family protein, partial [Streptomyces sp. NPDC005373]
MPDRLTPQSHVVALDVGGTSMKGALFDRRMLPRVTLRRPTPRQSGPDAVARVTLRRPTPRQSGPDAVVEAIARTLKELEALAEAKGLTVGGAGVAVPGIVDERTAHAVYSANIGWRDLQLGALLSEMTGIPVTLGHDVRAGGLAESKLGAARGAGDAPCTESPDRGARPSPVPSALMFV